MSWNFCMYEYIINGYVKGQRSVFELWQWGWCLLYVLCLRCENLKYILCTVLYALCSTTRKQKVLIHCRWNFMNIHRSMNIHKHEYSWWSYHLSYYSHMSWYSTLAGLYEIHSLPLWKTNQCTTPCVHTSGGTRGTSLPHKVKRQYVQI